MSGNESSVECAAPESYQPLILCCVARRLKRSFWGNIQALSCASEPEPRAKVDKTLAFCIGIWYQPLIWSAATPRHNKCACSVSMLEYTDAGSVWPMLLATCITFSPSQYHQQQQYESWCSSSPTVTWNRVMDLSIFATSFLLFFWSGNVWHSFELCKTWISNSGLPKEKTTWAGALKGKSNQARSETLYLAVYVGVGCGICVVHGTSIILLHAQSEGLSAELRPTLSF